jgi:hypothetical protein
VYLKRQRRQRFALAALFGLLVWLLVVAGHVHKADGDEEPAPSSTHTCVVCAQAQPAAGPVALPSVERREIAVAVYTQPDLSFTFAHSPSPYFSRGPPHS